MPKPDQVATVQESPLTDSWWDNLNEADEVEGYDLLKDEALLQLVGVPFAAFKAVYRDGIQREGVAYRDDYVSVELRVAPMKIWTRDMPRILTRRAAQKPAIAVGVPVAVYDEQLVINDGSSGIYRQITEYLDAKGHIKLPEGEKVGRDSILDLPRSQWLDGATAATEGIEFTLRCSRGLRYSDYENEFTVPGKPARTWYIA